jgi:hypothetical protein
MMLQQQQQEAQDKSLRIISMEMNYKCVFCAWGTSFSLLWELFITNEIFFVLLLVAGFTGFRPFQGGIAYCTADGDHKLRTINLSS